MFVSHSTHDLFRKTSGSIGSHRQLNIPKRQHLISCFCPLSSVSLSAPLFISLSPSSLRHTSLSTITSLSPYTLSPKQIHTYTLTRMNKHAQLCSVSLHCIPSPDFLRLHRFPSVQIVSYLLIAAALLPHLSITPTVGLLVLIRLFKAAICCWQQLCQVATAHK